jgi:hypothetical protein
LDDAASAAKTPPVAGAQATRGAEAMTPARYFQVLPEEAYWVTHEAGEDRVVVGGARLELSASGEVRRAAWEIDDEADPLQGSLAVAAHLGGGFLHWTSQRVLRSREFTGPLEPVSLGVAPGPDVAIRGARNGLHRVLIITESGPRELAPGAVRASSASEPALADLAAIGPDRALKLDVFGRSASTVDGGRTWIATWPAVGIAPRGVAVGPNELWLETWQGRAELTPDGKIGDPDPSFRTNIDYNRPFQLVLRGRRAADRESWPWGFRDVSPLHAAVFGGAVLADGTAIGVSHGSVARVDLATGEARSMSADWLPQGLECLPMLARGAGPQGDAAAQGATAASAESVLFVCTWESYQGHGGYVLRSTGGEPPIIEKAFSDDGYFVADDHGAVGFAGSCATTARLVEQEGRASESVDIIPKPVFCVRRGPDDWVERAVELEPGTTLMGWIPRIDGTAVALTVGIDADALPEPLHGEGARRAREQGGVRVVRLYQELGAFRWARPSFRPYMFGRGSPSVFVDKRYRARDDGRIDAWIGQGESYEMTSRVIAGVTLSREGRPTLHALPPSPSSVAATGDFGVTVTRDGRMFETLDHGRTWRDAGPSPIPPLSASGTCSRMGCVLPTVVRVGWGASRVDVRRGGEVPDDRDEEVISPPELECKPAGTLGFVAGGGAEGSASGASGGAEARGGKGGGSSRGGAAGVTAGGAAARQDSERPTVIATGYGDTIEIVRESGEDPSGAQGGSPALPGLGLGLPTAPSPTASPSTPPSAGATSAKASPSSSPLLRTHTLTWRPPFEPDAPVRRLNATNANFGYRRPPAVPLLDERGEIALLLFPDGSELLVTPDDVITLPSFEPRRYYFGDINVVTGLLRGRDRPLIFGDMRRRTSLEEHGPTPHRPPIYVALDRDQLRRRTLAIGRRDDGAAGVLVLDGPAPETAGVAELDRASTSMKPVARLAPWSTLTAASDPLCKAEKGAYRALITLDPSRWLALDARSLPGVTLGPQGIALVRWGSERVCLEALDITVRDARRRTDMGTSSLVIRWTGSGRAGPSAALRWEQLKQPLRCSLAPSAPRTPSASSAPPAPPAPNVSKGPR